MDQYHFNQKTDFSKEFLKNEKDPIHFCFYKKVRSVLQKEPSFLKQSRVMVALSGGVDSAVLLHSLVCFQVREGGPNILAAHIHHGVRGAQADLDLQEALAQARRHGIECVTHKLALSAIASEQAMREGRLNALLNLAKDNGAQMIVLGHHQQDQAETLLFRALRGTDLRGLVGIRMLRENIFFRPLLHLQKKDILIQARHRGLTFREDQSNRDTSKSRNAIRHLLLPVIQTSINPDAIGALAQLAESVCQVDAYLDEVVAQLGLIHTSPGQVWISAVPLKQQHQVIRRRLYAVVLEKFNLKTQAFSKKHIQAIDDLLIRNIGRKKIQLPKRIRVEYSNGVIMFTGEPSAKEGKLSVSGQSKVSQ